MHPYTTSLSMFFFKLFKQIFTHLVYVHDFPPRVFASHFLFVSRVVFEVSSRSHATRLQYSKKTNKNQLIRNATLIIIKAKLNTIGGC